MKLSVSVSDDDVATLDAFARSAGLASRSAAIQHAISLLRHLDLEAEYSAAWGEWSDSGEAAAWSATLGDGLDDAPR